MIMNTLQEIQAAIERLPLADQGRIVEWISGFAGEGYHIAEPAAAYQAVPDIQTMTVDEYLKFEIASVVRHEYVAGQIFAMSGTSLRHNRIANGVNVAFANHLGAGACQSYVSDVKVRFRINKDEYLYYPDVMVGCDREGETQHYLCNPKLIVEVLSPSTQYIDRREKAVHYRSIPALEEYVLIAQDICEVTIQRRSEDWRPAIFTSPQDTVEFRSIGLSLSVARIYEGV